MFCFACTKDLTPDTQRMHAVYKSLFTSDYRKSIDRIETTMFYTLKQYLLD